MTREEACNSMTLQDAIQVFKDTNAYGTMDIAKTIILKTLEQPNEDCISRKAVLEQASDYGSETFLIPVNAVKALSSVTPQPKTGYWIRKERADDGICCECSNCGHRSLLIYDYAGFEDDHETWSMFDFDTIPLQNKNYCSNCGLKMESEAKE